MYSHKRKGKLQIFTMFWFNLYKFFTVKNNWRWSWAQLALWIIVLQLIGFVYKDKDSTICTILMSSIDKIPPVQVLVARSNVAPSLKTQKWAAGSPPRQILLLDSLQLDGNYKLPGAQHRQNIFYMADCQLFYWYLYIIKIHSFYSNIFYAPIKKIKYKCCYQSWLYWATTFSPFTQSVAVNVHAVWLFVLEVPLAATTTTSGFQLVNFIAGNCHNSWFITL